VEKESSKRYAVRLRLGEILLKKKVINRDQLNRALTKQEKTVKSRPIEEILVEQRFITTGKLLKALRSIGTLGERLLAKKAVTRQQLEKALQRQKRKTHRRKLLGELLVEMGYVTEEDIEEIIYEAGMKLVENRLISKGQLNKAVEEMKKSTTKEPLGFILIDMGYVNEAQLMAAISKYAQVPYLKMQRYSIAKDVLALIPPVTARRLRIIPLNAMGGFLTLAMVDPLDHETVENIEKLTGYKVNRVMCTDKDFEFVFKKHFNERIALM
jgi:hypothetical protein